jgi:predicted RNA methylase
MRMQQFSTPVPLALLMAAAADLAKTAYASSRPCSKQKGEIAEKEKASGIEAASDQTGLENAAVAPHTVLESSAGCGALAMLAQKAGCVTLANELDPRRRALCAQVLDQNVSGVDAESIANADFAQDVVRVLINPPFSSSKARAGDTTIALRHAISAMACLKDGGRMVAILPDGAFGPRQSKWLSKLLDQAQVQETVQNFVLRRDSSNLRRSRYEHRQRPTGPIDGRPRAWRFIWSDGHFARTDKSARGTRIEHGNGSSPFRGGGTSGPSGAK